MLLAYAIVSPRCESDISWRNGSTFAVHNQAQTSSFRLLRSETNQLGHPSCSKKGMLDFSGCDNSAASSVKPTRPL